ncbi:hypothetical protein [Winogradskyella luteola]|uniref:Uncharacterized protein n=1 Tax=Winogradskyella luteola TaxID=2828330 RepID=A0A9X1F8W3_9FLAO|nr:hypothetical protein [Winogradskyella luteola]MBV7268115.1 hypothetical protein [Winogradskyella luteola]
MRKKVWYEMLQIKFGEIYLSLYLDFQKDLKRYIKIATLIFSGSGVFGWAFWEPLAWVACIIIAVIQLIALIENQIVRSDSELEEISVLRNMYLKYLTKLEELWYECDNNSKKEKRIKKEFFMLKDTDFVAIEKLDDKLNIKHWKKLKKKADIRTREYFNNF